MTLNEAFPQMERAIVQVWQAIGHDLEEYCQDVGEEDGNMVAVESCMDAGRFDTFVTKEMDELLKKLVDESNEEPSIGVKSKPSLSQRT